MTKKTTAITLSIFIAIMPFLGFPTSIKTAFYVFSGLLLAILIELISIQGRKTTRADTNGDNYTGRQIKTDIGRSTDEVYLNRKEDNEDSIDQKTTKGVL